MSLTGSALVIFAKLPGWAFEVIIFVLLSLLSLLFYKKIAGGIWRVTLSYWRKNDNDLYLKMREPLIKPLGLLVSMLFFNTALHQLPLIPEPYFSFILKLSDTFTAMLAFWLLISVVSSLGIVMMKGSRKKANNYSIGAVSLLTSTVRVLVIVIGIFVVLSFWVENISGIIAGIGIGGLAIALAAQDTLSNAIASLMILLDQPFDIGDWIETSDVAGSVVSIGLRSSRIRPLDQSIVTIPNSVLANGVISNGSSRSKRRVELHLTLPWTVRSETMELFRQDLLTLLEGQELVEAKTFQAFFSELAPEGARLTAFYFGPKDLDQLNLLQNELNLKILAIAENYGISFQTPLLYKESKES